ncbi:MAG: LexA family transcriptional regulator [Cyclobacteriaceae bacterium]|nr:LexA family transcriptional regulator [Cyclobacteriaceae bacterium]
MSLKKTFGDSLKLLRKGIGKTQQQVAEEMNMTRSQWASYELGTNEPNLTALTVISNYFNTPIESLLSKRFGRNVNLKMDTVANIYTKCLFVPHRAAAGYRTGFTDPIFLENLSMIDFPGLDKNATYRAFEIHGDSMPPFQSGFIVIGRQVEPDALKNLERYIVVTAHDGPVFKRVQYDFKKNGVILISDNPEFAPYLVGFDEILELWSFFAFIGFEKLLDFDKAEHVIDRLIRIEEKIDRIIPD